MKKNDANGGRIAPTIRERRLPVMFVVAAEQANHLSNPGSWHYQFTLSEEQVLAALL